MCGIFGYYNYNVARDRRAILQYLVTGLRRLEYRGYDSAGLAVDSAPLPGPPSGASPPEPQQHPQHHHPRRGSTSDGSDEGPSPTIIRAVGTIDRLWEAVSSDVPASSLGDVFSLHAGIAHTRWATHGAPCVENSHPHTSGPEGDFVVVHNGIITNYQVLKGFLEEKGFVFESETDTEVIPKLCKYVLDNKEEGVSFPQLVLEVMGLLEGAFALLIKSRRFPGELVACKRGSPLILGVRAPDSLRGTANRLSGTVDDPVECFVASDASAVVEHTTRVVVLEDGDLVHIRGPGYRVFNLQSKGQFRAADRAVTTLEMKVSEIMRGGFPHFMKKEIHEQPESLLQTMRGRVFFPQSGGLVTDGSAAASGSADDWGNNPLPAAAQANGNGPLSNGGAGTPTACRSPSNPNPPGPGPRSGSLPFSFPLPSSTSGIPTESPYDPDHSRMYVKLGGLMDHADTIRRSMRIMLVACGSSYHACLAARQTVEELTDLPVVLELASDLLDRKCPIHRNDTVIFLSQSGETADTLQALKYARSKGALCVGVTNTVGSAIARETDCGVHINAGCEIGVASTKAYTSQIVVITMIALLLSEDSYSKRPRRDEIIVGLRHLPDLVRATLALDGQMSELARKLEGEKSLLVFGRGFNYATAMECALKVKEIAYLHSEGMLAGEMKHGPLALVDENLQLLVVATRDAMHPKMLSVIQQLRARGGRMIVVCNEGDAEMEAAAPGSTLIRVPRTVDCLQPIVNIVPLQLLAYHLAVKKGFNVDQPRNLAKSVTVSD